MLTLDRYSMKSLSSFSGFSAVCPKPQYFFSDDDAVAEVALQNGCDGFIERVTIAHTSGLTVRTMELKRNY